MNDASRPLPTLSSTVPVFLLNRFLSAVERTFMVFAGAGMLAIMVIMIADVVARYAFNAPLSWAFEVLTRFLMPGLFFLSVSYALGMNKHLFIEIVQRKLPARASHLALGVLYVPVSVLIGAATWMKGGATYTSWIHNEVMAGGIRWPAWTAGAIVVIGLAVLTLRLFALAVHHLAMSAGSRVGGSPYYPEERM